MPTTTSMKWPFTLVGLIGLTGNWTAPNANEYPACYFFDLPTLTSKTRLLTPIL